MREGPPLLVSELRAGAAAQEELSWFFGQALAEIELPSSWAPTVRRAVFGGPRRRDTRQVDTGAEGRAEALHAARTIYERLKSLPRADIWVLTTLYTPVELPESLVKLCGWLAPLVCELPWTKSKLERAQREGRTRAPTAQEWLTEVVLVHGGAALRPLFDEAQGAAARAVAAYESTRLGFPESVVPDRKEG
jgi:hypothetical protein